MREKQRKRKFSAYHEILQDNFKMAVSRNRNGDVHARPHKRPDKAWDGLCPPSQNLHRESNGIDVRAIVGNDTERQDYQAKLAKLSKRREQDRGEQTTDCGLVVAFLVNIVTAVDIRRGHDGNAEHLTE